MIGKKIIKLDTVDSTNNYFANLLKSEELLNGTVILADEQTNGKGQRNATWDSEPFKNITMSIFLKHDNLSVNDQFILSQLICNSLVTFISEFNIESKIKWPNDIVISNTKIAGILIENQLKNEFIKRSIIGIGLNVNQKEFGTYLATSLCLQKNQLFNISELALLLIEHINKQYITFKNKNFNKIKNDYLNNLWLFQTDSIFEDKNGTFSAKIIGIDETGRLMVENENGIKTFAHKEIVFLERKME